MMEHEERRELFDDRERPVCNIRRFEMIKYSFGDDEEYVAIKENQFDDLTSTSKDAIHAYQEIFLTMDEGWMYGMIGKLTVTGTPTLDVVFDDQGVCIYFESLSWNG
ncbi:hypothetical protein Tco_0472648 [Tanacetum coccineum]